MKNNIIKQVILSLFYVSVDICLNNSGFQPDRYEIWLRKRRIFGDFGYYWAKRVLTVRAGVADFFAVLLCSILVVFVFFALMLLAATW